MGSLFLPKGQHFSPLYVSRRARKHRLYPSGLYKPFFFIPEGQEKGVFSEGWRLLFCPRSGYGGPKGQKPNFPPRATQTEGHQRYPPSGQEVLWTNNLRRSNSSSFWDSYIECNINNIYEIDNTYVCNHWSERCNSVSSSISIRVIWNSSRHSSKS
jgi:hypothetical protein